MPEDLQSIIGRAQTGEPLTSADIQILVAAIQSGQVTLATGQQAIGIGGSANGAVVVTGDGNVLFNVTDTEAFSKLLQLNLRAAISPPSSKATFQQFPEVSRFDLTQLVDKCLGELLGQRGLIGLAVPCGEKAFLKNFCTRLKHELGRSNIQIRQTLSLNPQIISVSKAVETIKQYKKLLQTGDVICPIQVGIGDVSSNIPKDFWQQLQSAFEGNFKYRLIIVMVGSENCIFPPDTIFLHPPRFEKIHAFQWIRDITQLLNWIDFNDAWTAKMIERCLGDVQTGCLDVGLVYEHLDYTLSILQNNPSLSATAFLEQLD